MNNKQGISTIVATVLIVLITVAAVTILWAAISPLVGENLEQSTNCLDVQNAVSIDTDATFTNYVDPTLNVRVERAANTDNLDGFQIFVEDGGNTVASFVFNVSDPASEVPSANGANVIDISTYASLPGLTNPQVSIAPRVLINGEGTSCTATSPQDVA